MRRSIKKAEKVIADLTAKDENFSVVINPQIQFGEPTIKGTRIPATQMALATRNGDPIKTTMRLYGLTEKQVSDCILFLRMYEEKK